MNEEVKKKLDDKIDPSRVKTSPDKFGSWIESHDAIRTANEIFGYDGWNSSVESLECVGEEEHGEKNGKPGYQVGYRAVVTVYLPTDGRAVGHSDTGFGSDVVYGSKVLAHELAAKEAVSDAVKRCLRHWGNQFGLSLYDKDAPTNNQTPKQKQDEKEVLAGLQGMTGLYPEDPGDFVITFGKHKGSKLSNIPKDYVSWLANKFEAKDEHGTAVVENAKKLLGQGEPEPQWTRSKDDVPF
jgi:DNA repair and recombination protein RAD52